MTVPFVVGIDPGLSGAIAMVLGTRIVGIANMPTTVRKLSTKERDEIDVVALNDMFVGLASVNVDLVVIERVGGIQRQSASASFNFGASWGYLPAFCVAHGLRYVLVPAITWKAAMGLRGKRASATSEERTAREVGAEIVAAAEAVFGPNPEFRGPKGGYRVDRAEAALLAEYGRRFAL